MSAYCIRSSMLIITLSMLCQSNAKGDLVAYYPMDGGTGNVLYDTSGFGNHGTIFNASWAFGSYGTALYFDGSSDGYVNCGHDPSLNIEKTGSVLVWFKPEAPIQGGLVCWGLGGSWAEQRFTTLLNNYGNYEELGFYLADGTDYFRPYRGPLPPLDSWSYLAVTFTERSVDVYLDGVLIDTKFQQLVSEITSYDMLIGKAFGWSQYGLFRGLIDEVRVYNNCLSDEQVFELYKAEAKNRGKDISGFETILILPEAYPKPGSIVADLDYRGLAPVSPTMVIKAELFKEKEVSKTAEAFSGTSKNIPGGKKQAGSLDAGQKAENVIAGTVRKLPVWGDARAEFNVQKMPPGTYVVRAQAFKDKIQIGSTATKKVFWPGRETGWEDISVLNNLCWELLKVSPGQNQKPLYRFSHPCSGWVYFSTEATGTLTISVSGGIPPIIHDPSGNEKRGSCNS